MKNLSKLVLAVATASLFSVSANAFDKDHSTLTFSKSQGPYTELFIAGVQTILEKEGYTVKGVDVSDLLQADIALNEGEVVYNDTEICVEKRVYPKYRYLNRFF